MPRLSLAALALASLASAAPTPTASAAAANCFPYGSAKLPSDNSAPNVSLSDWWCPQSMRYGFQGFSYPLEDGDCSDASNSFDQMNKDFAAMKRDFGATVVRAYYPVCTEASVFENMLKAGIANNMAVIPQVWFDFGDDNSVWPKSQAALYSVMDSAEYGAVAPYVFMSADFGSEPIGDGVDNGPDQFVKDLAAFRAKMNGYGVPAGISEDWDRPGTMSGSNGQGLASVGKQIQQNSDYVHAHVMPFYHNVNTEADTWGYIGPQLTWLNQTVGLPVAITETQWAWAVNQHNPGVTDVGVPQYTAYWKKFDAECETFKKLNIAWFLHAWYGEDSFDMVYDNGSYVIPNWRPTPC